MRDVIQEVNIDFGDDVSRMMYQASRQTHENRPGMLVEGHESFSGFRGILAAYLGDTQDLVLGMGFDGVGTKVEVAERIGDHSGVAYDLFAMVCDDAVVRGAEPLAVGSILDVRHLDETEHVRNSLQQLATGYVGAAKAAGVVVINGEVAELGDRVGGYEGTEGNRFNYNWGATVFWAAHKDRALTGSQIKPGDALVGLREAGFRSNGITDVRKALLREYGNDWQHEVVPGLGAETLGRLVVRPSTIYSRLVTELTGGYDIDREPKARITGVAHITGGGQPSKLGRMLEPSGYGAEICDPLRPPEIMKHVQDLCGFSDEQAYRKWHMGPGMIIATPEPDRVMAEVTAQGFEGGVIGTVSSRPGIDLVNTASRRDRRWLRFE